MAMTASVVGHSGQLPEGTGWSDRESLSLGLPLVVSRDSYLCSAVRVTVLTFHDDCTFWLKKKDFARICIFQFLISNSPHKLILSLWAWSAHWFAWYSSNLWDFEFLIGFTQGLHQSFFVPNIIFPCLLQHLIIVSAYSPRKAISAFCSRWTCTFCLPDRVCTLSRSRSLSPLTTKSLQHLTRYLAPVSSCGTNLICWYRLQAADCWKPSKSSEATTESCFSSRCSWSACAHCWRRRKSWLITCVRKWFSQIARLSSFWRSGTREHIPIPVSGREVGAVCGGEEQNDEEVSGTPRSVLWNMLWDEMFFFWVRTRDNTTPVNISILEPHAMRVRRLFVLRHARHDKTEKMCDVLCLHLSVAYKGFAISCRRNSLKKNCEFIICDLSIRDPCHWCSRHWESWCSRCHQFCEDDEEEKKVARNKSSNFDSTTPILLANVSIEWSLPHSLVLRNRGILSTFFSCRRLVRIFVMGLKSLVAFIGTLSTTCDLVIGCLGVRAIGCLGVRVATNFVTMWWGRKNVARSKSSNFWLIHSNSPRGGFIKWSFVDVKQCDDTIFSSRKEPEDWRCKSQSTTSSQMPQDPGSIPPLSTSTHRLSRAMSHVDQYRPNTYRPWWDPMSCHKTRFPSTSLLTLSFFGIKELCRPFSCRRLVRIFVVVPGCGVRDVDRREVVQVSAIFFRPSMGCDSVPFMFLCSSFGIIAFQWSLCHWARRVSSLLSESLVQGNKELW